MSNLVSDKHTLTVHGTTKQNALFHTGASYPYIVYVWKMHKFGLKSIIYGCSNERNLFLLGMGRCVRPEKHKISNWLVYIFHPVWSFIVCCVLPIIIVHAFTLAYSMLTFGGSFVHCPYETWKWFSRSNNVSFLDFIVCFMSGTVLIVSCYDLHNFRIFGSGVLLCLRSRCYFYFIFNSLPVVWQHRHSQHCCCCEFLLLYQMHSTLP